MRQGAQKHLIVAVRTGRTGGLECVSASASAGGGAGRVGFDAMFGGLFSPSWTERFNRGWMAFADSIGICEQPYSAFARLLPGNNAIRVHLAADGPRSFVSPGAAAGELLDSEAESAPVKERIRTTFLEGERTFMSRLSMVSDFWAFLRQKKKFWLLPIVIVLLALGVFLVFASTSALAPFIYSIF